MIRMIAGVYGLPVKQPDGSTHIKAMGPGDGSFSLPAEREAELVARGAACYVGEAPAAPTAEPKLLNEMNVRELRETAKQYGVVLRVGLSKAEMVAIVEAAMAQSDDETEEADGDNEGDEPDELAPTFDDVV